MHAARACRIAAIFVVCAAILIAGVIGLPAAAHAAVPGPYISITSPQDGAQAIIVPTTYLGNPSYRQINLSVTVDDPDGIGTVRSLKLRQPNGAILTVSTTFTYAAGTAETKATIAGYVRNTTLAQGTYVATLVCQDKSGVQTTYIWTFYAGLTTPVVSATTPSRGGVAASPYAPVTCNLAGPRSAVTAASMTIDGAAVPTTLLKTSNLVNTLSHTPASPLAEGLHTATVSVTNASGLSNTYTWTFTVAATSPGFLLTAPAVGSEVSADADGTFALSGLACDADGIDPASLTLTVSQSGAVVVPDVALRIANGRAVVDITARIPVAGVSGAFTVTPTGTDALGNTASGVPWSFTAPAAPPSIDAPEPAEGTAATSTSVRVAARMRDYGSGIDPSTIELTLDGEVLDGVATEPVADGVIAYATVELADNTHHTASAAVANLDGQTTTLGWSFDVAAVPVASGISPAAGSTYHFEDVPLRVTFTEPADAIDVASLVVTFDGAPVPAEDITAALSDGGHTLAVTALVRNVGGQGSTTHAATARVADSTGAVGQSAWSFDVFPQTGTADIVIDENEPCLSAACHVIPATDMNAWNRVHWVVGDARGWGIPDTGIRHKYSCNICHYSQLGSGGVYTPAPLHVPGLDPCAMCHAVPGGLPVPTGVHGATDALADYSFLDHDDPALYALNSPHAEEGAPRDCLYCHQGTIGSQEIENHANGTISVAHDVVDDHRIGYPDDSCQACHSAVLSREHAFDRDGDGDTPASDCSVCHASTRPEVRAAVDHAYPALRFRFWGLDSAAYLTSPVPGASVETTAYYEIPGEMITGAKVRIMCSTLGTVMIELSLIHI